MLASMILPLLAVAAAAPAPGQRLCPLSGVQQLRIYEIFDRNKAAFHARFRDHAQRIMKRHGFDILAMWETKQGDRTEFVYLLQWPDERTMKRSWDRFMADEEWSRIKKEWAAVHGQAVGEIQDRTLKRTDYSPC
jgi:hypothetical protein